MKVELLAYLMVGELVGLLAVVKVVQLGDS